MLQTDLDALHLYARNQLNYCQNIVSLCAYSFRCSFRPSPSPRRVGSNLERVDGQEPGVIALNLTPRFLLPVSSVVHRRFRCQLSS